MVSVGVPRQFPPILFPLDNSFQDNSPRDNSHPRQLPPWTTHEENSTFFGRGGGSCLRGNCHGEELYGWGLSQGLGRGREGVVWSKSVGACEKFTFILIMKDLHSHSESEVYSVFIHVFSS